MEERPSRRQFLSRGAGIVAGATLLSMFRPVVSLALPSIESEDLVDSGNGFRRGTAHGVAIGAGPEGPVLRATTAGGMYTSTVLQSSIRYTHVGLHWSATGGPLANLTFELRTSPDGATWSPWQTARPDCLPGKTSLEESFAALIYAPDARFVQYRATFALAGSASPVLHRVTASVIASPPLALAGTVLPTITIGDTVSQRVLTLTSREQWGADESLRLSKRGAEVWPEMFVPAKKLVVHHTATRNDYADAAAAAAEVRAIYRYHAVTQRWGDIGYNALVDKFGNIYEGRHGRGEGNATTTPPGRETLSAGVVAGHVYDHNYGSAGIALLGDATKVDWPMSGASGPMWDALVRYSVFEAGRHFLRPLRAGAAAQTSDADIAVSDFLRSDDAWTDNMRNISGHRESYPTTCPGDKVMSLLSDLRNAIHTGLTDTSRTGVLLYNISPGGRETEVNKPITYDWLAEPPQTGWALVGYEFCFEGWYKPSKSYDIQYLSGYTSDAQPRPVWTPAATDVTKASFTPTSAGHYTFHVRAVLQNSGGQRRSAYESNHTYLVKSPAKKPRGRSGN